MECASCDELTPRDFTNGNARRFVRQKLLESDAGFSEGGYDTFGGELETTSYSLTVMLWLYKFYFRVEVHGIENVPADGAGLIVSNHAPIVPFDAAMIALAFLVELEKPRFVRTIINKAISAIPWFSILVQRGGQVIGCEENVRRIFENRNLVVVFPTGAEGDVHSIFNKYRIERFAVGFMEYALRYRTPVIPTCVTGSEEAAMTLGKLDLNMGGFKHLPLTPTFPWLGLLGLFPFPSKFDIHFDPPRDYFSERADEADDPARVRELVDELHDYIQLMLDHKLDRPPTIESDVYPYR